MANLISEWDRNPYASFERFVATVDFVMTGSRRLRNADSLAPISDESATVYKFMFQKFCTWMQAEGLRMSTLDTPALLRFIKLASKDGQRDLNSKIAFRYVRLIERCFDHLKLDVNPAKALVHAASRQKQEIGRDSAMIALTPQSQAAFVAALPAGDSWKRRRDRAMQLTMLYGGLRVAEAIGLLVPEVTGQGNLDGSLELAITPEAKHRSSYEHTTRLRAEGAGELVTWMQERARLRIPGHLVFPSNLDGKPLNKATVYRQVKATFTRAGINVNRAGGRTLRNTFAVQELAEGTPPTDLVEHLGLALLRSTEAYAACKDLK